MSFTDWLDETRTRYRNHPPSIATKVSAVELLAGTIRHLPVSREGTQIWDREWDVLILLDACRYDLMGEVASEYEWIDDVGEHTSVASMSYEFIEKSFVDEYADEMQETALVSANPFTQEFPLGQKFAYLDEVWRHSWDSDLGIVLADTVVDAAIHAWRRRGDHGANRMIVWMMQPHVPFVNHPDICKGYDGDEVGQWGGPDASRDDYSPWEQVQFGMLDEEVVWEAYRDNLRYALNSVETLRTSITADQVVISSDHGNCVGEFGLYGHPPYTPIDALHRVPWVRTTAEDDGTYTPEYNPSPTHSGEDHRDKQLEALGYK